MTLYFTTNASSGDGSLAALYASATDGDVIAPDPSVFPLGSMIEITLASALTSACNITIDGAGRRIRFNGASAPRCIVGGAYSHTFQDCDFVGFTGKSQTIVAVGSGELHFVRCLLAGNDTTGVGIVYGSGTSVITIDDSAFYGNSASSGAVYVAGTSTLTITRSTVIGNVTRDIYAGGNCTTTAVNSIYQTALNIQTVTDCTVGAPSSIGFVAPPPDSVTYSASAWESWNLHLLTSTATDPDALGYDLDGIPRAVSSIVGAYGVDFCDFYGNEDGWATNRFGTYSTQTTPTDSSKCLLLGSTTYDFNDVSVECVTCGNIAATLTHGTIALSLGMNAGATAGTDSTVHIKAEDLDAVIPASGSTLVIDGNFAWGLLIVPTGVTTEISGAAEVDSLTVNGALVIDNFVRVDDLTVSADAVITLGADARLSATTSATFGACDIIASRGYLATPAGTDTTAIEITGDVVMLTYGAGCVSFDASFQSRGVVGFEWEQADPTVNPLLEVYNDGWQTLSISATTAYTYEGDGGTFRLYDGDMFFTDYLAPVSAVQYWQVKAWADATASGGTEGDSETFSVSVWAVSPNLES